MKFISMTRRIANMEDQFRTSLRRPFQTQSFIQSTKNIFRTITATKRFKAHAKGTEVLDAMSELQNLETFLVRVIAIGNERKTQVLNFTAFRLTDQVIDDLANRVLNAIDVRLH
jgi:capsular polysaccharide biosynthesis protein